jgi:ubiquinone/menaquinone biosynthesis C-methylase UbiE
VLKSRGAAVVAADFSTSALRIAQEKARTARDGEGRITLTQADAHHLPFASKSFDLVVSCETIEHLIDPSAALDEMARVCKPGGLLYLTTPNYLNLMGLYLIYDFLLKKDRRSPETQPLDRRWIFLQVRRLVNNGSWNILLADGIVHQVPYPGRNPIRLSFLEHNALVRRSLRGVAFHYFLLARKEDRQKV